MDIAGRDIRKTYPKPFVTDFREGLVVDDLSVFLYQIEDRLIPTDLEQRGLSTYLHGVTLGKRSWQFAGGFDFQNPYKGLWSTGLQREVQMGLDGYILMQNLDFQLSQRRESVSKEILMNARFKPMSPGAAADTEEPRQSPSIHGRGVCLQARPVGSRASCRY